MKRTYIIGVIIWVILLMVGYVFSQQHRSIALLHALEAEAIQEQETTIQEQSEQLAATISMGLLADESDEEIWESALQENGTLCAQIKNDAIREQCLLEQTWKEIVESKNAGRCNELGDRAPYCILQLRLEAAVEQKNATLCLQVPGEELQQHCAKQYYRSLFFAGETILCTQVPIPQREACVQAQEYVAQAAVPAKAAEQEERTFLLTALRTRNLQFCSQLEERNAGMAAYCTGVVMEAIAVDTGVEVAELCALLPEDMVDVPVSLEESTTRKESVREACMRISL